MEFSGATNKVAGFPKKNDDLVVRISNHAQTGKYGNVKHVLIFIFLWYIHICKYI
jgi:hypothetical protein